MPAEVADLLAQARDGSPRALGRLLTLVEDGAAQLPELMAAVLPYAGDPHVVGITGAPGVGKSTTTSALVGRYRAAGRRVAVLAVDPSSPFTGGALLGDRVRMSEHALDDGVFVRSMASRGQLGGLAAATPQALRVLAAAGFEVVLVETVGVGQSEVEVAGAADTTAVLLGPGAGDGIQAAKAGILEIGDVLVVNKADQSGAGATESALRTVVARAGTLAPGDWQRPVLRTVAVRGEGIDALVEALSSHRQWLVDTGQLQVRRRRRAEQEVASLALGLLRTRLSDPAGAEQVAALAARVVTAELDPYAAAAQLVAELHP
ncbi:MAG TPA: methylmalonyl Co-A mutase-associated GTPase MeaB [Candidatus Nanopelagicales bacterium]|nr:methylmalonyl Co-A mutase-associated GTPase MeaB [Candidatus Nanopelagicales bacterium]